jgi:hypothetical protein
MPTITRSDAAFRKRIALARSVAPHVRRSPSSRLSSARRPINQDRFAVASPNSDQSAEVPGQRHVAADTAGVYNTSGAETARSTFLGPGAKASATSDEYNDAFLFEPSEADRNARWNKTQMMQVLTDLGQSAMGLNADRGTSTDDEAIRSTTAAAPIFTITSTSEIPCFRDGVPPTKEVRSSIAQHHILNADWDLRLSGPNRASIRRRHMMQLPDAPPEQKCIEVTVASAMSGLAVGSGVDLANGQEDKGRERQHWIQPWHQHWLQSARKRYLSAQISARLHCRLQQNFGVLRWSLLSAANEAGGASKVGEVRTDLRSSRVAEANGWRRLFRVQRRLLSAAAHCHQTMAHHRILQTTMMQPPGRFSDPTDNDEGYGGTLGSTLTGPSSLRIGTFASQTRTRQGRAIDEFITRIKVDEKATMRPVGSRKAGESEDEIAEILANTAIARMKYIDALLLDLGASPTDEFGCANMTQQRALPTHQAQRVLHAIDEWSTLKPGTDAAAKASVCFVHGYALMRLVPMLRDPQVALEQAIWRLAGGSNIFASEDKGSRNSRGRQGIHDGESTKFDDLWRAALGLMAGSDQTVSAYADGKYPQLLNEISDLIGAAARQKKEESRGARPRATASGAEPMKKESTPSAAALKAAALRADAMMGQWLEGAQDCFATAQSLNDAASALSRATAAHLAAVDSIVAEMSGTSKATSAQEHRGDLRASPASPKSAGVCNHDNNADKDSTLWALSMVRGKLLISPLSPSFAFIHQRLGAAGHWFLKVLHERGRAAVEISAFSQAATKQVGEGARELGKTRKVAQQCMTAEEELNIWRNGMGGLAAAAVNNSRRVRSALDFYALTTLHDGTPTGTLGALARKKASPNAHTAHTALIINQALFAEALRRNKKDDIPNNGEGIEEDENESTCSVREDASSDGGNEGSIRLAEGTLWVADANSGEEEDGGADDTTRAEDWVKEEEVYHSAEEDMDISDRTPPTKNPFLYLREESSGNAPAASLRLPTKLLLRDMSRAMRKKLGRTAATHHAGNGRVAGGARGMNMSHFRFGGSSRASMRLDNTKEVLQERATANSGLKLAFTTGIVQSGVRIGVRRVCAEEWVYTYGGRDRGVNMGRVTASMARPESIARISESVARAVQLDARFSESVARAQYAK